MISTAWKVTRRLFSMLLLVAIVSTIGCTVKTKPSPTSLSELTKIPEDQELARQLDEALDWTFENRHLNTDEHATWQILHGVLTYKRDFMVRHEGKMVSAVDHLLAGGYMEGWDAWPGTVFDDETKSQGLQVRMAAGSGTGQGHYDQWLAVLAQCDLAATQKILAQNKPFTMNDYVAQVQWDLPRNLDQEYSWTLIGLTAYLPTDAKWQASDGQEWSISQLVQAEAEQAADDEGACGGTHRLIGLSMALKRHLDNDGQLTGPWELANQQIQDAVARAKMYQNADGSFSSNYLQRGGVSPDYGEVLGASGHVLEFLALALTKDQLQEPWVKRSVVHLCRLFKQTRAVELKCGPLYHATHGLSLYRQKVFDKPIEQTTQSQAGAKPAAGS